MKRLETRLERLEQRIKPADDRDCIDLILIVGKSPCATDDREEEEDSFIMDVNHIKR